MIVVWASTAAAERVLTVSEITEKSHFYWLNDIKNKN